MSSHTGQDRQRPATTRSSSPGIVVASADDGLRRHWLEGLAEEPSVGEERDFTTLRRLLRAAAPAILLVDLGLPGLGGADGISGVVRLSPSTRVVAITGSPDDREALAALLAGAHGYAEQRTDAAMIRKMVDAVRKGEIWARRRVMLTVLRELIPTSRGGERDAAPEGMDARLQPLTRREREIAYLVSAGAKNKDIATSLNITETTVKAHLTAIFRKLGIPDRLRLALMITEGDRLEQERTGRSRSRG